MKPEIMLILGFYIAFAVAEAIRTGFFKKDGEKPDDAKVEIISTLALIALDLADRHFCSGYREHADRPSNHRPGSHPARL